MLRPTLIAAAALLLAAPAHAVAPAGFYEPSKLETAASSIAGKRVQVLCADSVAVWRTWTHSIGHGKAGGAALIGGTVMRFAPDICQFLLSRQRGRPVPLYSLGASILAFTHEAIHLRGERDEGKTDCTASYEMAGVAQRFFGFKTYAARRALMAQVARYRALEPAAYRTVC